MHVNRKEIIQVPPQNSFTLENRSVNGLLWLQHKSAHYIEDTIEPQSYKSLSKIRSKEYNMDKRKRSDQKYRQLLDHTKRQTSLVYSTLVGFNKMRQYNEYPGYIYFTPITDEIINNSLFGVISDQKTTLPFIKGFDSLKRCLEYWEAEIATMSKGARVEVISSTPITYEKVILQAEGR